MISIAIDGPSGVGKSTTAKRAAERFGFKYVDTGAIYRTIAYGIKAMGIDAEDRNAVISALDRLCIDIAYNTSGEQCMYLNGSDVSPEIRTNEISMLTSIVSSYPEVRAFLLDMQRGMAKKYDVIMDGRDIGTVILPDADLKIFLTASPEERAKRRQKQLEDKGVASDFEELLREMKKRDEQDTQRSLSPLVPARDAVIIDSSEYSKDETLGLLSELITERTGRLPL